MTSLTQIEWEERMNISNHSNGILNWDGKEEEEKKKETDDLSYVPLSSFDVSSRCEIHPIIRIEKDEEEGEREGGLTKCIHHPLLRIPFISSLRSLSFSSSFSSLKGRWTFYLLIGVRTEWKRIHTMGEREGRGGERRWSSFPFGLLNQRLTKSGGRLVWKREGKGPFVGKTREEKTRLAPVKLSFTRPESTHYGGFPWEI